MTMPPLDDIAAARARLAGRLHLTPVFGSALIGAQCDVASLTFKCESFQKTGSFKVRGALNAISVLDAASRARGVVTVSAGNHAAAVAWAARAEGVRATVVMLAGASKTKVAACESYGANVILHGTGAEAFAKARALSDEHGFVFIHPFEDPGVIAGAATCGLEILDQVPDVEMIVVPIGGGGLISGIASGVKQTRPSVRIIGVEPTGADSMARSIAAGHAVRLDALPNTIADGLASPMAGDVNYEIVKRTVDEVVLVTDDEIAAAMQLIMTRAKLLVEPAAAATTAALMTHRIPAAKGKRVVAIVSGGNMDLERLKALL